MISRIGPSKLCRFQHAPRGINPLYRAPPDPPRHRGPHGSPRHPCRTERVPPPSTVAEEVLNGDPRTPGALTAVVEKLSYSRGGKEKGYGFRSAATTEALSPLLEC